MHTMSTGLSKGRGDTKGFWRFGAFASRFVGLRDTFVL